MRSLYQEDSSTRNQGFTLVELAIVMTIIGLLIGGVLKGQEMIENARLTATIAQVKSYQAAIHTFKDKYDQIPGDFSRATTRLSGCTDTSYCYNGNSNARVDNGTASSSDPGYNSSVIGWAETIQFWKHLGASDLIAGVNPSANTATTSLAWGKTHPSSSLGGGFEFYYDPCVSTISASSCGSGSSHLLRLSNAGITGANITTAGQSVMSAKQAAVIDRKMDDGKPGTGWVTVEDDGNVCLLTASATSDYAETKTTKDCTMYWLFDR